MTADPDFLAWVEDARAVPVAEVAARRGLALKRCGTELVGPCPVCGGHDRFGISTRKNVWSCRGAGRGGDAIALVQYLDGRDFLGAVEDLTGRPPPRGEARSPQEEAARLAALAARERAREEEAAQSRAKSALYREAERERLYQQWRAARPIAGTPAAAYLTRRGLPDPRAPALRFAPAAPYFHGHEADGRKRMLGRGPALLAVLTNDRGTFAGLHYTWLDLDAPDGKRAWIDPETGEVLPARKARGSKQGASIVLVRPYGPVRRMVMGEGIETTLSPWAARARLDLAGDDTLWAAAVDLGNLAGRAEALVRHPTLTRTDKAGRVMPVRIPGPVPDWSSSAVTIPPEITELVLLGDGDSEEVFTRLALERACARHAQEGRIVRAVFAPKDKDFNDVLRNGWPAPSAAGAPRAKTTGVAA